MKKILALLLSVMIILALCSCGERGVVSVTTESAKPTMESAAPVETETLVEVTPAPAETGEPGMDSETLEKFEKAQALKGEDIEKLYEAIGYPVSTDYAPSCLAQGGQDGELVYDGFVVISFKNGDTEVVYEVLTDGEYYG